MKGTDEVEGGKKARAEEEGGVDGAKEEGDEEERKKVRARGGRGKEKERRERERGRREGEQKG